MPEAAPTAMAIDTVRRVATPEGCEIALRVAGPVTRAQAWLYDMLLRMLGWAVLGTLAGYLADLGFGVFVLGVFLLEWFYPILFEVYMRGQTPGKRACGLVVLHDDGRPVGWGGSFIRNTVRFIDFLPLFYATGFIATLLDADARRLGDLAAGTVVVHGESAQRPKKTRPAEDEEAGSEPPPLPLKLEEQRALLEYRERIGQFTPERAEELAAIAAPLTAGMTPDAGRRRLLRVANFLRGQR